MLNQDFVLPIKVSSRSQRQSYIFDLIFKQLLGLDYQLIDKNSTEKYLDYSSQESDFSFFQHDYLNEEGASLPRFKQGIYEGKVFPFFNDSLDTVLPFDPFATCLYFVTRHEELNSLDLDSHGRYKSENSWLWKNNWRLEPIVNYIAYLLREKIEAYFSVTINCSKTFNVFPSVDIDNAYAYYGRGESIVPSMLKSLLKLNFNECLLKWVSRRDKNKDPFNTHENLMHLLSKHKFRVKFFFLMKSGGRNSNNSAEVMGQLALEYKNNGFELGIHPSYRVNKASLKSEKSTLENYIRKHINCSRHHFIAIQFHKDYLVLEEHGIKEDYSMGYPNQSGFRAGICESYLWFDITSNNLTALKVYPFYFMDASYIFYSKSGIEWALEETTMITTIVKKYKGELHFVIHNEALSNVGVYQGWGQFLSKTLEVCD